MSDHSNDRGAPHPRRPHGAYDPEDPSAFRQQVEELERRSGSAARLFDVRRIIGGLFVIYGVIVTVAGFFTSDAALEKAEGININLWTGLAMLVLGLLFLLWLRLSPAVPPPPPGEAAEAPGSAPSGGPESATGEPRRPE
ncbi:hypothetical protein [Streptomyces sp. JJ36]|uniref:hypothetical protein n=1 Tax=Streptomyces sp. JJ36 TaxID=2736645 RepID=UPI001F21FF34|nr:hypothetical protein [Streptomyces sp. JJ36]